MDFASALLCLTLNLFKEAEGEGLENMRIVGDVVINRVESKDYPNDVCSVVLQKKQFSWANNLRNRNIETLVDVQANTLIKIGNDDIRLNAYRDAEAIARYILSKDYKPRYRFLYFYSGKSPYWANGKQGLRKGRLTFMR